MNALDLALSAYGSSWLTVFALWSLKSAVFLSAIALVTVIFRFTSAASRHFVWAAALLGVLALPLAGALLPTIPLPSSIAALGEIGQTPAAVSVRTPAAQPPALSLTRRIDEQPASATGPASSSSGMPAQTVRWIRLDIVVAILCAGAMLALLRLTIAIVSVRRLARAARPLTDTAWVNLAAQLHSDLALTSEVRLLESDQPVLPMAWGWRRPVVVVPREASNWSEARRRVVILHELAHIKRGDVMTQMMAEMVRALHWFNPMVWFATRQLRLERERACDDRVLELGTKASDYATELLAIARARRRLAWPVASMAMARPSQLEGRLLAILDQHRVRGAVNRWSAGVAVVLVVMLVAPLAALHAVPSRRPGIRPATHSAQTASGRAATAATEKNVVPRSQAAPTESRIATLHSGSRQTQMSAPATSPSAPADPVRSRATEALISALKDSDVKVRRDAALALWEMRAPEAVGPLIAALKDSDADVRRKAVLGLSEIGDKRAVAPIIECLKDEDAEVRAKATLALSELHAADAVVALIAALKDADPEVRRKATLALGEVGDERAVDALTDALHDSDAEVRSKATSALRRILNRRDGVGIGEKR